MWLPCKATRTVMFIKAETSIRIMQIYEIFPKDNSPLCGKEGREIWNFRQI